MDWDDLQDVCTELEANPSDTLLSEADTILQQIRIHITGVKDAKTKQQLRAKLKLYEDRITRFKVLEHHTTTTTQPTDLNLQRLQASLQQLQQSEEVATDTVLHLKTQGEALQRVHGNLKETTDGLATSNQLLRRMSQWWRG